MAKVCARICSRYSSRGVSTASQRSTRVPKTAVLTTYRRWNRTYFPITTSGP